MKLDIFLLTASFIIVELCVRGIDKIEKSRADNRAKSEMIKIIDTLFTLRK